jgi:plastocyanin
MTIRHTAVAAVSVVGLAAIIGPQAAGSGERGRAHAAATSVSVSGKEFRFTLSRRSAPHGSITFRFTNRGKIGHDFKIAGKKTRVIKPRKSTSLTVRLKRGRYKYICTVSGHASSGMKGTFRVT